MGKSRYSVASCLGATMCFGGLEPTLRELKKIITPGGQIVIGEAIYTTHKVPDELRDYEGNCPDRDEALQHGQSRGL